jgi:hypothetical protein
MYVAALIVGLSYAEASDTMLFKEALPGRKLLACEVVAAAGYIETDKAAVHSGHDLRFPVCRPSCGAGRR